MSEQFEQKEEDHWEHREGEMQVERAFRSFLSAGDQQCGLKVSKKLEDWWQASQPYPGVTG